MNNRKDVYTIIRTGKGTIWLRIGRAFINKDGSLNVVMHALPVDGRIQIREPKPVEVEAA